MGIFVHNLVSKFAKHLQPCKFDAIAAITTFAAGCEVSANLFSRPMYYLLMTTREISNMTSIH